MIKIRPAAPGDLNFILSTWLRCFKHSSYWSKRIRNSVYYAFHHTVVEKLISRSTLLVACDPLDENVIFGWLAHDQFEGQPILHFLYVKAPFRDAGVARALISQAQVDPNKASFSHWTFACDTLVEKFPGLVYCPYFMSP